jgi:predicted nucleotidyltransferase component of viral defense system
VINLEEIRLVAARVALSNTVVEKDYALGWLLWGLSQHRMTSRDWVFKGGTCLKKCYFETYRFSEDLDFSYRGNDEPTADSLVQIMSEVSDLVLNEAGLEFPKSSIQFEIFQNQRGSVSIQGGIKYRGPVRPQVGLKQMPRIKIDLTLDEPLVLPPVLKSVDHPYSDKPDGGISILSYAYEEVFAEKVRALSQRLRPRDLYDVVHLHRRLDLNPDREKVYKTLVSKCRLRGINVPTMESLETHDNRSFLESEWENQLSHQIPVLPNFQSFLSELPGVLSWLLGEQSDELQTVSIPMEGDEIEVQVLEVETLVHSRPANVFMDRIRFAAANRLLVRLGYNGSQRDIEPYALARSSEGALLIQAIRHQDGQSRSYRFDRIETVQVLEQSFTPRYAIEITSAGILPVHQLKFDGFGEDRDHTSRRRVSSKKDLTKRSGPIYLYRCLVCRKEFRKKTNESHLNAHKNNSGYECHGRTGIYLKTLY